MIKWISEKRHEGIFLINSTVNHRFRDSGSWPATLEALWKLLAFQQTLFLPPSRNTNIPEAFEAKLKNIKGSSGLAYPFVSGFLAQVFILNPRSSCRVNVSVILPACSNERKMLLTRHYPTIRILGRTCSRSIGGEGDNVGRKWRWNAHIRAEGKGQVCLLMQSRITIGIFFAVR